MACVAQSFNESINFNLSISPDPLSVRDALEQLDHWLAGFRGDQADRSSTQVVMAEVLNNIVEHGSLGPNQNIRSSISVMSNGIECSVIDEAPVYRALANLSGEPSLTCEASIQLAEGGYGVFLIQSLVVDIRYIEVERGNHLEFRIPLTTFSEQIY